MKKLILFILYILNFEVVFAKDVSILFIGNSYTYLQNIGSPENPELPRMIQKIAKSIDTNLNINYSFRTQGGYSFEKHYNDIESINLLKSKYDHIVLQGRSTESLDLPPWWSQNGLSDLKSFEVFFPQILNLALKASHNVTVYVNWGWHPRNSNLQDSAPGLYFPVGSDRAGEKWCGQNKYEFQKMINDSYIQHTRGYPVTLSMVGQAWISLQDKNIVHQDELYIENDWSHASVLGGYIAALVLTRDILHLDIRKSTFVPDGVSQERARRIIENLKRTE